MVFDTLAYMQRLEAGGVERKQAEAHAAAVNEYLRPDLAMKDDMISVRIELRGEINNMEQRLLAALSAMETRAAQRETRLLTMFITAVAALLGITVALLKLV